jgi:hypothetical protein
MSLRWRQDGYLYFAHTGYGMWTIEQRRGRFEISLTLRNAVGDQDFGSRKSLASAKREVEKADKSFALLA